MKTYRYTQRLKHGNDSIAKRALQWTPQGIGATTVGTGWNWSPNF